jgi:hypothetical protein
MEGTTKAHGQRLFEASTDRPWDGLSQQQKDLWAQLEAERDLLLSVGWLPQRGGAPEAYGWSMLTELRLATEHAVADQGRGEG